MTIAAKIRKIVSLSILLWASLTIPFSGSPTLTVGDSIGFIEDGGIIRFSKEDYRVVFTISREREGICHLRPAASNKRVQSHIFPPSTIRG